MMSDTLAYADSHTLLLTGLCTLQVLRTVEMLEMCIRDRDPERANKPYRLA